MSETARPTARRARGRWTWVDVLCVGGFVFGPAYHLAMTPVVPWLLATHPVLAELLQGSSLAMIVSGGRVHAGQAGAWIVIAAPTISLMAFDPFAWWAGQRFGRQVLAAGWLRRQRPGLHRAERWFLRWRGLSVAAAYYLPLPTTLLYLAAGETGMPLPRFLLLDLLGTLLWVAPIVALGYALGQRAQALAEAITHFAWAITALLVVGFILQALWRARRDREKSVAHPM
ncbi:MAG: DedA family protein [Chloroflexota bacterium]